VEKQNKMVNTPKDLSQKAIETRQGLLDTARTLFAQVGFETAKVSDIVAASGLSQGTFYYHFKDKEAVMVEILEMFFKKVQNLSEKWASTPNAETETIEQFARGVAVLIYDNHEIVKILKNEGNGRDRKISRMVKGFYQDIYKNITLAMELGIKLGLVRECDSRIVAVGLVGMIKEVIEDKVENKDQVDLNQIVEELTRFINFGIRPEGF
jgi:TetR/AcrR family transcriptional regulator, fatty acid metabolism regulator protein